jgi:hypothetical protein
MAPEVAGLVYSGHLGAADNAAVIFSASVRAKSSIALSGWRDKHGRRLQGLNPSRNRTILGRRWQGPRIGAVAKLTLMGLSSTA